MRVRDPDRLRDLVHERGLTQRALAGRIGVSHGFVAHLMPVGDQPPRRDGCTRPVAEHIARELGVGLDELFEETHGRRRRGGSA